jgi:hypothetical protein
MVFSYSKIKQKIDLRMVVLCGRQSPNYTKGLGNDIADTFRVVFFSFVFHLRQVKLVDVEKVEWLNRRSYSVIGLLLGREGRVLLRCDSGLEDWFELLEECALVSKERRMALRLTQGPRSRASLAAPPTHASLQSGHHMGLGSTYSSALEDWLHAKNKNFLHADSVPDLSQLSENNGLLTNQSTPKKIPKTKNGFHIHTNGYASHNGSLGGNNSSYTPYSPLKKLLNNNLLNNSLINNNNSSCLNGNSYIINDADEDEEVELRQHNLNGRNQQRHGHRYRSSEREEDMYRRPYAPSEQRHSCKYRPHRIIKNTDNGNFWLKFLHSSFIIFNSIDRHRHIGL